MSAGAGQESERFAAAVEHGQSAVSPGDEQLLRELEVAALLRRSQAALNPDPDASARMRATVMAAATTLLPAPADRTPVKNALTTAAGQSLAPADRPETTSETIVSAEAATSNVVSIGTARGRHRSARGGADTAGGAGSATAASPRRRGLLGVSAAAGLLLLAVTGGGALFSRDALPGDSLYGLKQTTESALVGLTPGQAKSQRQLDIAATRLDEVKQLSSQPASNSRDADIGQALREFDQQSAAGSRMRLSSAGSGNGAELGALANWAQAQSSTLSAMRSSLPSSAQPDADHSQRQMEDLRTRAQSLRNRQGCDTVTSGQSDQLGPLPAKGACSGKSATVKGAAPTPGLSSASNGASTDRSSLSRSSSPDSDHPGVSSEETGRTRSTGQDGPELPVLGGMSGGSDTGGAAPRPGRQSTKDDTQVPTTGQQAPPPGLNLGNLIPGPRGN